MGAVYVYGCYVGSAVDVVWLVMLSDDYDVVEGYVVWHGLVPFVALFLGWCRWCLGAKEDFVAELLFDTAGLPVARCGGSLRGVRI